MVNILIWQKKWIYLTKTKSKTKDKKLEENIDSYFDSEKREKKLLPDVINPYLFLNNFSFDQFMIILFTFLWKICVSTFLHYSQFFIARSFSIKYETCSWIE